MALGMLLAAGLSGGCRREAPPAATAPDALSAQPHPESKLVFPPELQAADESVNEFVHRSMAVCAAGDYEQFRLIWSAREEPLPRAEYEQGWQAVREIRIRALREVRLATEAAPPGPAAAQRYIIYADVLFDPEQRAGEQNPRRTIISLIVHESDGWKLARAPKSLREWLEREVTGVMSPEAGGEGSGPAIVDEHPQRD